MAPFPDEVDVFTAPHWRMKQLVGRYCDKVKERGAEGGRGGAAGFREAWPACLPQPPRWRRASPSPAPRHPRGSRTFPPGSREPALAAAWDERSRD